MSILTMLCWGVEDPFPWSWSGSSNLEHCSPASRRAASTDLVPLHCMPVECAMAFNWEALHFASQDSAEAIHCARGNSYCIMGSQKGKEDLKGEE